MRCIRTCRYLYANVRKWRPLFATELSGNYLPMEQEMEIHAIDLKTFNFVQPVLTSHRAISTERCCFIRLDISCDYVARQPLQSSIKCIRHVARYLMYPFTKRLDINHHYVARFSLNSHISLILAIYYIVRQLSHTITQRLDIGHHYCRQRLLCSLIKYILFLVFLFGNIICCNYNICLLSLNDFSQKIPLLGCIIIVFVIFEKMYYVIPKLSKVV